MIKVSNPMFFNVLDAMVRADWEIPRFGEGFVQFSKGIDRDHSQSYDGLVVTR